MKIAEAMVSNRTVALVGNSAAILRERLADEIESYEIVVRMNLGVQVDPEAVGRRTDIWAAARYWPDALPQHCRMLLWMKLTKLGKKELADWQRDPPPCPIEVWPQELETECRKFVGADPSTGIRLLWWLKDHAALIKPFGMDCWREVSHWSGRRNTPNHDPDKEWDAMRRLGYVT